MSLYLEAFKPDTILMLPPRSGLRAWNLVWVVARYLSGICQGVRTGILPYNGKMNIKVLERDIAEAALSFLNRTDIKGSEAKRMVIVQSEIARLGGLIPDGVSITSKGPDDEGKGQHETDN